MKNIIITTDFSTHSKNAIRSVLEIIRNSSVAYRVLLLNTYLVSPNTPNEKVIEENDRIRKLSQNLLSQEKEAILKELLGNGGEHQHITVETSSRMGTLQNIVSQMLEREKFDFVAMGKDGGRNVQTIASMLKTQKGPPLFVSF